MITDDRNKNNCYAFTKIMNLSLVGLLNFHQNIFNLYIKRILYEKWCIDDINVRRNLIS